MNYIVLNKITQLRTQRWIGDKITQLLIYVTSVTLIGCEFIIFDKIYGW